MEADEIIPGCLYTNKKTQNIYEVLEVATHSETLEQLVVYKRHVVGQDRWWVRPVTIFTEKFERFVSRD